MNTQPSGFKAIFLGLATALLLSGCFHGTSAQDYSQLGPALQKLSSAVHAAVKYDDVPADTNVLSAATADQPHLLIPFTEDGLYLQVREENSWTSVLVCDEPGGHALFEDVGCSGKLERSPWDETPIAACTFTFSPQAVCTTP